MEKHSAELNALNKNEIDKLKRTSMHNLITMNWLKSRHVDKAKLQYLFFPEELYKHSEINELFRGFDSDQSDGIEVSELISMFKDNNIQLERQEIDTIFHLVDANGDNSLNLSEFKRSVFSDQVNHSFAELMRNYRTRQKAKDEILKRRMESPSYLLTLLKGNQSKRPSLLQPSDDVTYDEMQPVNALKSPLGSQNEIEEEEERNLIIEKSSANIEKNNLNIEKSRRNIPQSNPNIQKVDQLLSKRTLKGENNAYFSERSVKVHSITSLPGNDNDNKEQNQRVIPTSFASMVEFFSYNFQRKEQIKKCESMASTLALQKAAQLKNLMELSSKYTEQTINKIQKLHGKYNFRSFNLLPEIDEKSPQTKNQPQQQQQQQPQKQQKVKSVFKQKFSEQNNMTNDPIKEEEETRDNTIKEKLNISKDEINQEIILSSPQTQDTVQNNINKIDNSNINNHSLNTKLTSLLTSKTPPKLIGQFKNMNSTLLHQLDGKSNAKWESMSNKSSSKMDHTFFFPSQRNTSLHVVPPFQFEKNKTQFNFSHHHTPLGYVEPTLPTNKEDTQNNQTHENAINNLSYSFQQSHKKSFQSPNHHQLSSISQSSFQTTLNDQSAQMGSVDQTPQNSVSTHSVGRLTKILKQSCHKHQQSRNTSKNKSMDISTCYKEKDLNFGQTHFNNTYFKIKQSNHVKNCVHDHFIVSQNVSKEQISLQGTRTPTPVNISRTSLNNRIIGKRQSQNSFISEDDQNKKLAMRLEQQFLKDTVNKLNLEEQPKKEQENFPKDESHKQPPIQEEFGNEFKQFSFSKRAPSHPDLFTTKKNKEKIPKRSQIKSVCSSQKRFQLSNFCFSDALLDEKIEGGEEEQKFKAQPQLLLQRIASSQSSQVSFHNNLSSQPSGKKIETQTRSSNFTISTPPTTAGNQFHTFTPFSSTFNNPKSQQSKKFTFL